MDKERPESGKVYALTGGVDAKCIMNGNTWKESEVKPEGTINPVRQGKEFKQIKK